MVSPARFAIVGNGWRAAIMRRLAEPEQVPLEFVGTVRRGDDLEAALAELAPEFVVVAVPWEPAPGIIERCVALGIPVLTETPPAPDRLGLDRLWTAVGESGLVQVAEQYPRYPGHLARAAVIASGAIGTPTSAQVSSTHGYHAVALLRKFVVAGTGPARVRATAFDAPLADPVGREGRRPDPTTERPARTVLATFDWGDGRSGLLDFTDNQWHNPLRFRRVLVRGSQGEIRDDDVVRIDAAGRFIDGHLLRRQLGHDLELEGYDTEHIVFEGDVVWTNSFVGARFADEDIAIASLLVDTAAWVRGEAAAPYPLAEGAQDQLLSLAVDEALASDATVDVAAAAWHAG